MADSSSKPPRGLHSAEVFEEEIEDLERTTPNNWSTWLAGVGAFALLAGVVLAVMAYEAQNRRTAGGIGNLPAVRLVEPTGTLEHLPALFRWEPVSGADSYLLSVQRKDGDDVVLLRSARGTTLATTAQDLSQFGIGAYHWTVEARGGNGKTRAWGEGEFELAPAAP